jgi:hypothetical protein
MPKYFPTVGLTCAMPGAQPGSICGNRFSARTTPALPVCPECRDAADRAADAVRQAEKRRRKAAARRQRLTA